MKKLKIEPQTAVLVMLKGTQHKHASALLAWLNSRGIAYNAPGLERPKAEKPKKVAVTN